MIITLKGANFSGAGNNIGNLSQIGGTFTFTINPTPSDATVKINGTARKSITGAYGTAISWEVSKDGYNTRTGSLTMPLGGKTLPVSLTAVGSVNPPVTPEEPGTGGVSGTQLISTFRNNPANAQYVHDGTYKIVDGVVTFAGNGNTYKYLILPLDVFNITDLKCVTGIEGTNDISPIVFLKNNEMKSENIVGDLTFGKTQKVDGATMHTAFMYYNDGFPSIPEGANYVAFSDFIDRETLKVSDEKLTITFG